MSALPAVATEALTLLLADARLPIGGHARSATLEPALEDGLRDIPGYVRLRLRTVARIDAGAAVVTRAQWRAAAESERLTVATQVAAAWAARTPSAPLRADAALVGSALQRLARTLWAMPNLPTDLPGSVVLGVIAAEQDLEPAALARLVGYDDIQTVVSASLKLRPDDPARATGWVLSAFPELEALVAATSSLTHIDDIPALSVPAIDRWADLHTRAPRRLFRV